MDYRFSMTPRLLVLAVLGLLALFVLLFLLGMQVGQRLEQGPRPGKAEAVGAAALKPLSNAIPSAPSLNLPAGASATAPAPAAAPVPAPAPARP
jgi:hypothetical protein